MHGSQIDALVVEVDQRLPHIQYHVEQRGRSKLFVNAREPKKVGEKKVCM